MGWWNQLKTLHEFDLPRRCSDNIVIWDILIAHRRQLYAGEINLKDSASLIVLWWFVLQKHWETPSVEYFACVNRGSSWPQSCINSENGSVCAHTWMVIRESHNAQRPLLWICSRWWSDQSSWSLPELCVARSPYRAQLQFLWWKAALFPEQR